MVDIRIRANLELITQMKMLTEGTNARTYTEQLRWIINRLRQLQREKKHACQGITKGEMEHIIGELKGGWS